jgi:hypothetical protein
MSDSKTVHGTLVRRSVIRRAEVQFMSFVIVKDSPELGPFTTKDEAAEAFVAWCEAGGDRPDSNIVAFPADRARGWR